jgi:hypothetical protein
MTALRSARRWMELCVSDAMFVLACALLCMQGGDAKFFQTTKKGEIHELKADLNSLNREKIKDAGQTHKQHDTELDRRDMARDEMLTPFSSLLSFQRCTVKKVIAAMTVGKDVSSLFTDVVKSMQTDNVRHSTQRTEEATIVTMLTIRYCVISSSWS